MEARSRLDPRVTARGAVWLGQGRAAAAHRQCRLRAVVASRPSRSTKRAGQTQTSGASVHRALGSPQARAELGWRAGGLPRGAPEPCKGKGQSARVPLPSPAPAPETPPAAATQGTAWGRAAVLRGGGHRAPPRPHGASPLLPRRAGHRGASRPPRARGSGWRAPAGTARSPPLQPAPPGRTRAEPGCARCVTQRLTTAPEHHVLPPAAKTGRQAARRSSGSRGSACGGLAPAQPEQTTDADLKCNRLRPTPSRGYLSARPLAEAGAQPPRGVAPQRCSAGPARPRPPQGREGRPHPCSPGDPQGLGERTPVLHHA